MFPRSYEVRCSPELEASGALIRPPALPNPADACRGRHAAKAVREPQPASHPCAARGERH